MCRFKIGVGYKHSQMSIYSLIWVLDQKKIVFTYVGFHFKYEFIKVLCSQMLVFTLILVHKKYYKWFGSKTYFEQKEASHFMNLIHFLEPSYNVWFGQTIISPNWYVYW